MWLIELNKLSGLLCGSVVADGKEHRMKTHVFLISRVWVRVPVVTDVSLSKTINHCFVLGT